MTIQAFWVFFLFLFIISLCYDFMEFKFVHYLACSQKKGRKFKVINTLDFSRVFSNLSQAFSPSFLLSYKERGFADLAVFSYILFDIVAVCAESLISLYALTTLFLKKSFPVQSSSDKWNKTIAVATFF